MMIIMKRSPTLFKKIQSKNVDWKIISTMSKMRLQKSPTHPNSNDNKMSLIWKHPPTNIKWNHISKNKFQRMSINNINMNRINCLMMYFMNMFVKKIYMQNSMHSIKSEILYEIVHKIPTITKPY